jgi:hypothetical protein
VLKEVTVFVWAWIASLFVLLVLALRELWRRRPYHYGASPVGSWYVDWKARDRLADALLVARPSNRYSYHGRSTFT